MTEVTILILSIIISLIAGAFITIRQSKREKEKLNIKINDLQNDKVKLENEKSLLEAQSVMKQKHHEEQIDLIKQEKRDAASTIKEATNETIQPLVAKIIKDDEERKNYMEQKMIAVRAEQDEVEKIKKEIRAEKFKKEYEQKYSSYSRGKEGEKILKELLCQDLHLIEGETVKFQQNPGDISGIPDTIVFGPEDRKLFIDSKFPLIEFDNLHNASEEGDTELIKKLESEIGKKVKSRIDDLAKKKYHESKGSYPFTIMFLPSKALLHAAENCFEEDSKNNKNENRDFHRYCLDKKIRVFDPHDVWSKVEEIKHMWTIFQSDKNESEDRKFMDKWLNDSRIFYDQYFKFAKAFENTNKLFGETTKQIKNKFSEVAKGLSYSEVDKNSQKIINISNEIASRDSKKD